MEIPKGRKKLTSSNGFSSNYDSSDEEEDTSVSKRVTSKIGLNPTSPHEEQKAALLWALLASYLPEDVKSIQRQFVHHVEYTLARGRGNLTSFEAFQAFAYSVRDRMIERLKDTQIYFKEKQCKRVAYISMEFLLGRSLQNAIVNLGIEDNCAQALRGLGLHLEELYEEEQDAGLGNGGLGRLAACFLDSLATMDYPAWGYGLRYKYGTFYQKLKDGNQIELPYYWLNSGNPWEIERQDVTYPVHFYGYVRDHVDEDGKKRSLWEPSQEILAVAYDTPVPGYETYNTLHIRLWSARPSKEFDYEMFSKGDFYKSLAEKQQSEALTAIIYPNDNTDEGKELRIKQQYFLVCATLQDLVRRLKEMNKPLTEFPSYIAIQLNDTHPTLGIIELMRILIDYEKIPWKEAWYITTCTFSYTHHTVSKESLEKWPVSILERVLPRHLKIIYDINHQFLSSIEKQYDVEKLRAMSIIEEGPVRYVRMANLAIIGSHTINGVAELHTHLIQTGIFPEFYQLWPDKFLNMTNGVTPRRWLHQANPDLGLVISAWLRRTDWVVNTELLAGLRPFAASAELHKQWMAVKRKNKIKLAQYVEEKCGITIPVDALFDVQVKRIHEYKRQLLNILYVIHRYNTIKQMSPEEHSTVVPRVVFFGGKAAPDYATGKLIIKVINDVASTINSDKSIRDLLKVVFIPNYCVSVAEVIIPATELSQHISTAGFEASGTSNMKFVMNGSLILGSLDGANVEILKEIGQDNMFTFGLTSMETASARAKLRSMKVDPRFEAVLASIENGSFGDSFAPIVRALRDNDHYLLSVDFPSYIQAQEEIDNAYKSPTVWTTKSILSCAGSGKFSCDRTIKEYAENIWDIRPVRRPGPVPVSLERLERTLQLSTGFDPSPTDTRKGAFVSLERMTPKYERKIL